MTSCICRKYGPIEQGCPIHDLSGRPEGRWDWIRWRCRQCGAPLVCGSSGWHQLTAWHCSTVRVGDFDFMHHMENSRRYGQEPPTWALMLLDERDELEAKLRWGERVD